MKKLLAKHEQRMNLALALLSATHPQAEFADLLDLVDVVSFDLFDTLLQRDGLFSPKDLFYQVEVSVKQQLGIQLDNFTAMRVRAEGMARVRAWGKGCAEITLDQIYTELGRLRGWNAEILKQIQQIELDCERAVLCVLASGLANYNAALAAGKKVIITSDTYFAESFIADILQQTSYSAVHKLYLSATWGKTKQEGDLYDVVLRDLACTPSQLLHVGDNSLSDITMALGRGIRTHYVPTAKQHWRWHHETGDIPSGDPMLSTLLCALSEQAQQEPRASTQPAVLAQTATENLAVLYYAFAAWLVVQLKAGGYHRVYFAARDGLIMKKFFDLVARAAGFTIDSRYLYISRAALYPSLIFTDPEAARELFSRSWNHLTVKEALERLSLSFEQHQVTLRTYGFLHRTQRLDTSNTLQFQAFLIYIWPLLEGKNRENYQQIVAYLQQEMVLDQEKAAFVDIGWHGSLQDCLLKLLQHRGIVKEFHGYYLGTFARPRGATADFVTKGFLLNNEEPHTLAQLVRLGPSLLELFHSASHGGVLGYTHTDKYVQPMLDSNPLEQQQYQQIIEPMQKLALDFVAQHLTQFSGIVPATPEPELVARTALRVIYAPTPAQAAIFGRLCIASDFGGPMKSITGAIEWNLQNIPGETLPDGTVPIWRPGFNQLKHLG